MADCYALEADDLHRRWLPREIFADLGIVDTDSAAAAKPEAAAATVEELAVQLASILGATAGTGGEGKAAPRAPPPAPPVAAVAAPPPPSPAAAAPRKAKQVRPAVKSNVGGGNGAGAGAGAAVAWRPVPPYSPLPVQWQVPNHLALTYAMLPPPPPCLVPPPPPGANLRGGTGVFLPRAGPYRYAPPPPPAKDEKAPNVMTPSPRAWPGTGGAVQQPQKKEEVAAAAAGRSSQMVVPVPQPQVQKKKAAAAPVHPWPEAAAALPQDWSYH